MKVLVTGGAGFIGSAVCRLLIGEQNAAVLNVDKLTYAANLMSLRTIENNPRYAFRQADICDRQAMCGLMEDFDPDAVLHLAAESHVDRSIDGPLEFTKTNVEGTCVLLGQRSPIGSGFRPIAALDFVFITSRPTRFSGRLELPANSPKRRRTNRTRHIRRLRLLPITWSGRGGRRLACRQC